MLCYLMEIMRKLVILLSVVAVSFALQAGDGACSKNKAACGKSKTAAGEKAKTGTCDKAKKAEEAAKKPAPSPKTAS